MPRRSTPEMVAELMREAGLLLAVFLPLDFMFSDVLPLTRISLALMIVLPVIFITAGIILELKRHD